jgi:tetratricopeptide (TPR) repeat protein
MGLVEDDAEPETVDAAGTQADVAAEEGEPSDAAGWIAHGRALYKREHMEEALAAFDRAIELAPDDAEGWAWRGAVLNNGLKRHEEALAAYEHATTLRPDLDWAGMAEGGHCAI